MTLRPVPNPHTNQVLHEAEVWIKDGRGRRKLDLLVKYSTRHPVDKTHDTTPLRSAEGSMEQIHPQKQQQSFLSATNNSGGETSYPSNG